MTIDTIPAPAHQTHPAILAGSPEAEAVLSELLKHTNVDRKIAIAVNNHTAYHLVDAQLYLYSGKVDQAASQINSNEVNFITASKTSGAARGSVGVISYALQKTALRLAILWSVPYDYNLYENWFKLKLIPEHIETDYDLYSRLYADAQAANHGALQIHDDGFTVIGTMGTGYTTTLAVSIH